MATVIICPSCGTRYEIAAVIPPEGRKVRCSKCSHIWQARPIPPMPEMPIAAPPREEPVPPPPMPPETPDFSSYVPEPPAESSFGTPYEEVPPGATEEERGFFPASNGRDGSGYESYAQQDADFDAGGDLAPDQPAEGSAAMESAAPDDSRIFGEWDTASPAEAPAAPEIVVPASAPAPESGRSTRLGWLLLILFLLGLIGFVLMAPRTVVSMLPGATRLYAVLGMPVNSMGLALQGVSYGWNQEGEETVLEVKGDIVNLTDAAIKLPIVVVVLLDENGKELSQYTTVASEAPLGAGETAPFLAEIASPPAEVRKLKVRFAKAQ
jgi:predicted Zn finger-like uncharacterized protein